MTFRNGLVDPRQIDEMLRPLQLDLEAAFKAMRDDAMRELRAAVKAGADPTEIIQRVDAALGAGEEDA